MIEMAIDLFNGEVGLVAELAKQSLRILLLHEATAITIVLLLFRDLLKAVAGQVKAGVA
jgi:hypothetical protein